MKDKTKLDLADPDRFDIDDVELDMIDEIERELKTKKESDDLEWNEKVKKEKVREKNNAYCER